MLTSKGEKAERPWLAIILLALAGVVVLGSFLLQDSIAQLGIALTSSTAPGALLTGIGLLACAASMYAQPTTRVLAGWMGAALAVVALPAANFGGFILGTVLGILGAAAALSWSEGERKRHKKQSPAADESNDQPADEPADEDSASGNLSR